MIAQSRSVVLLNLPGHLMSATDFTSSHLDKCTQTKKATVTVTNGTVTRDGKTRTTSSQVSMARTFKHTHHRTHWQCVCKQTHRDNKRAITIWHTVFRLPEKAEPWQGNSDKTRKPRNHSSCQRGKLLPHCHCHVLISSLWLRVWHLMQWISIYQR